MELSRSFGRPKRGGPLRMKKVFAVATTAVTVAVVSLLIGSTIATGNGKIERNIVRGRKGFENGYRGLRGDVAAMDGVKPASYFNSQKEGKRKRKRTRQLSSTATSAAAAGDRRIPPSIPPLTSFGLQNYNAAWDDIPILDGSLQLPSRQQTHTTTIDLDESYGIDNSNTSISDYDDDFLFPPIQPRIVGGSEDSDLDSFVMQLRYVPEDKMWKFAGCGGTLISKCHILTAGHCMVGDRVDRTKAVYVNAWRPFSSNTDDSTGKTKPYHVSLIDNDKTIIHPNFNNTGNLNDIAVLTMTRCIPEERANLFEVMEVANDEFWRERQTELLISENNDDIDNMNNGVRDAITKTRVAGFGQLDVDDTSVPPTLQSVDVSLFGREDCEAKYRENLLFSSSNVIQPDMYCAGAVNGGKDACLGDSGGPNYFTDPATSKRIQLGVVSWGIGCADEGFPGVYTSVAYHYDFIRTVVCEDERLGDFGATQLGTISSQSKTTAASPLILCLPNDVPTNNNVNGGDPEDPIIVGNDLDNNINEFHDDPILEEELPGSCSEKNVVCQNDGECCDGLVCTKRDKLCKIPPRQNKGRLTDGQYGGSASSQIRTVSF